MFHTRWHLSWFFQQPHPSMASNPKQRGYRRDSKILVQPTIQGVPSVSSTWTGTEYRGNDVSSGNCTKDLSNVQQPHIRQGQGGKRKSPEPHSERFQSPRLYK